MKKSLVVTLAIVFVLGIAGTAFAAANPFVDVPAKHWAYDAVSKLAQAGVVDGYGDGTFRGDKTMTRYEMAQIVAKAMVRSDKANAETKALVDKLAVEFNAELQNLGVRVAKLEKEQPNLKFTGKFDVRYKSTSYDNDYIAGLTGPNSGASYRLRLEGLAKVDDKTSFGMRFVTQAPDKTNFKNDTWMGFGADNTNAKLDRIFVATKIGAVDTTIGRQAIKIDAFDAAIDSGAFSFDGVKFASKLGDFDVAVNHGRLANGVSYTLTNVKDSTVYSNPKLNDFKYMDVDSINVASKYGKLSYGFGYAYIKNNNSDKDLMKYWMGNASYLFDKKFSLAGEYLVNKAEDDNNNFWAVKAIYGDQALTAKGKQNLTVQYSDVGRYAISNRLTTLDTPNISYMWYRPAGHHHNAKLYWSGDRTDDYNVLDINYNYAFSKSLIGQLQWVKVDDTPNCQRGHDVLDYQYWKVTLSALF